MKQNEPMVDRFAKPSETLTAVDAAFGSSNIRDLMPRRDEIPEDIRRGKSRWIDFQQKWFFSGLKNATLVPRDGIDKNAALRHLSAIQGSFEPKHEDKEAAVAYLASRWFTDASTW